MRTTESSGEDIIIYIWLAQNHINLTMYKGAYQMMDIKSNKVFPSKSSYVQRGFCVIEHKKPTFTHMMYQNNPGAFINLY